MIPGGDREQRRVDTKQDVVTAAPSGLEVRRRDAALLVGGSVLA